MLLNDCTLVDDEEMTEFEKSGLNYDAICEYDKDSQLNFAAGHKGLGALLNSFSGDGVFGVDEVFSVIGYYDGDNALTKIELTFSDHDGSVKRKKIGEIKVDSGKLLITDPCYILE